MSERRNGFSFSESFLQAAEDLTDEERLAFYDAIIGYGITGEMPEVSGVTKALFALVKPVLSSGQSKAHAGVKGDASKKEGGSKAKASSNAVASSHKTSHNKAASSPKRSKNEVTLAQKTLPKSPDILHGTLQGSLHGTLQGSLHSPLQGALPLNKQNKTKPPPYHPPKERRTLTTSLLSGSATPI